MPLASFDVYLRALAACFLSMAANACHTADVSPATKLATMHVTIERSGGFAGITLNKTLDAGSLSADESNRLAALLEAARFFELPALIPSKPQPDRFQYRIAIEQDGKTHSVTLSEHTLSHELKTLVDWLMKSAHPLK